MVTMAEMYNKNHADGYKLHVIKQTVNTITVFLDCLNTFLEIISSLSLQNKDPGGGVGSTSRGWRLVGLGVEMGRFGGGDGWV